MCHDLNEAKQRLLDKLGPNYGIYVQLLGRWFRGHISKHEFDKSAKQLIKQNFILEHNKFWLAFFNHCANSATNSISKHFQSGECFKGDPNQIFSDNNGTVFSDPKLSFNNRSTPSTSTNFRSLPDKVMTHMKIFVIAWEMGLDSVDDNVSMCMNIALQNFLKNIITELVCTKTAYRLRENRFKHAIGVKPINPYLSNSLKIFSSTLEYDPYQIESNKMNSSLVDTYAYNDSLFPSRLYEVQALYEYACSTSTVSETSDTHRNKRLKLSEVFLNQPDSFSISEINKKESEATGSLSMNGLSMNGHSKVLDGKSIPKVEETDKATDICQVADLCHSTRSERKLTLYHLLVAFLTNRTIVPSQSLYSINLERIFNKLSC